MRIAQEDSRANLMSRLAAAPGALRSHVALVRLHDQGARVALQPRTAVDFGGSVEFDVPQACTNWLRSEFDLDDDALRLVIESHAVALAQQHPGQIARVPMRFTSSLMALAQLARTN